MSDRRSALIAAVVVGLLVPLAAGGQRTAAAATAGPALSLDAGAGRHTISPLIYGMNNYGVDPGAVRRTPGADPAVGR